MDAITINLQVFEDAIFNEHLPYEINLVSKSRDELLGHLFLDQQNDFAIPVLKASSFEEPISNNANSQKQAKKRSCSQIPAPKHAPAKFGKSNSLSSNVSNSENVANNVASSVPQPNVDSFISVNQNLATGDKTMQCTFCGFSTHLRTSIKRHVENKHMPSCKVFKCQSCENVTFNQKANLKRHYMTKHGIPEPAAAEMLIC